MRKEETKDILGKKYGLLTITEDLGVSPKGRAVMCLCECGKEYWCRLYTLKRGDTVSCGCYRSGKVTVHGLKGHPVYRHWKAMKTRCYNKNIKQYPDYGGRGIRVSDTWTDDFKSFYDWAIANGWRKGLSLDRFPNNDGNYEPINCRWATRREQAANKRNNRWIEYKGQRKIAQHWADEIGVSVSLLLKRISQWGWPLEKAMTKDLYNSKGNKKALIKEVG